MAKRGGFPEENQKALEEKEFTATAGGGAVEVTISGKKEVTKVKISEDAVDPDDVEMLEDLIMAATNEALRKVEDEAAKAMGKRIHQSVDRAAVPSAWNRCENRTEAGISYHEYAGRPGKTAGRFDHRSKIPRPVLQVLPDPDRQRAVPDLRKCQARPQRDHGGGDDAGSCGI